LQGASDLQEDPGLTFTLASQRSPFWCFDFDREVPVTKTAIHRPDPAVPVNFRQAGERVLEYLREHLPMGFWSVTRIENGRQTYLALGSNAYGLPPGGSHPWASSICVRMIEHGGPRVAPIVDDVPEYADAPVRQAVPINAYCGSPILDVDGSLFGVICGISPEAEQGPKVEAQPLLDLLAGLLTDVLRGERVAAQLENLELERLALSDRDPVTGLAGLRTWDAAINREFERFSRLADPTSVLFVSAKVDPRASTSQDDVARRTASAMRQALPDDAVAARLGGHFGVLLRNSEEMQSLQIAEQLVRHLKSVDLRAYVGVAAWRLAEGPFVAIDEAFNQMNSEIQADLTSAAR
jgi:GGDEF domain-containing protein